jgi:hypothetical protein
VLGIPEEQFLELIARFPEKGFSGQNPKVNEAARDGVTEWEKKQNAEHLGILHTQLHLRIQTRLPLYRRSERAASIREQWQKILKFPFQSWLIRRGRFAR